MLRHLVKGIIVFGLIQGAHSFAMPLSEYNLIVLEDFNGSVHVQGKTIIGADMYAPNSILASESTLQFSNSLEVVGDINGNNIQVQNGNVVYGGTNNATLQVHNGTISQDTSLSINAIKNELIDASQAYTDLDANGLITGDMNGRFFSYTGTESVAVFDIDASFFDNTRGLGFALGSASTAIINVSGNSVDVRSGMNFLGDFQSAIGKVVWNFIDATTIAFNNKFVGSVLATQASVVNNGFDIDGSFASLNYTATNTNEFHQFLFTPPEVSVNEPNPAMLLLIGCGLLGLSAKRKKLAQ